MLSVDSAFGSTSILDFAVSPNGQWAAYTSNVRSTSDVDLYVVSTSGGTPVRVSRTRTTLGGRVASFDWSPDSTQLTYAGNLGGGSLSNLNAKEVFPGGS